MRISDWSSDVCSSDLDIDVDPGAVPFDAEFIGVDLLARELQVARFGPRVARRVRRPRECRDAGGILCIGPRGRDRKRTRLHSSHYCAPRMPSSARKKKHTQQLNAPLLTSAYLGPSRPYSTDTYSPNQ